MATLNKTGLFCINEIKNTFWKTVFKIQGYWDEENVKIVY